MEDGSYGRNIVSSFSEFGSLVKNRHKPKDKPTDTKVALGSLTPWLIGAFCLSLMPMMYSLVISFTKYNMIKPPQFVGLMNYRHMRGVTDSALPRVRN